MRARLVLPLLLMFGCGGAAKPAPLVKPVEPPKDVIPKTSGPPCATVGDRLAVALGEGRTADQLARMCTGGKWNDEVRSCFSAAENPEEVQGCQAKLTPGQLSAFGDGPVGGARPEPTTMAPPPPPPAPGGAAPKPTTRAPVKKQPKGGADPCQGGE